MIDKENREAMRAKLMESIKIREICEELGIDDREAKLIVQIHTVSQKGSLGIQAFENQAVYDQIVTTFPIEVVRHIDKQFEMIGKNYFSEQVEDLLRMFTDEKFRQENYTTYQGILPRLYQQRGPQALM